MGRTTIDIVKLTFALASNTKAITQEAINQIQEVEEAGKDIKINLSDENIQSQAQHIISLLEGALKKIDIGKLPVNFITDLLDPDVTFEQNNANLTHLHDRLVDISKLPDDIREKLSGMPSIDWDEIFNIDQEDLQASKESIEDYVVSEKEAIKELNALLEERNALQDQITQKQKKLDANNTGKKPISQKEQNDLKNEIADAKAQLKYIELEELKYFTRIRSLNSSLTDNQFNNHLDETELIADENDIKRYNSVIARAFEESNTAITEHIEALRSIKDISDFDNWYKTKHVTQNINDYLDSVDTKKIGERLDKSVSASGIGLSLDVSDEEVTKFLSEIQRKIDASKGIRLKIQLDKIISDIESALKNHGFVTNLKGKSENNKIKPTDILSILSGWNTADSIFIDKNKTFANYRERGMAFNSQNGEYTNPYAYSGHGEFNMNKEILAEYKATHKDVKDLRGAFDSWIHTHPSNKAAFSGQDYVSMAAKRDEYGINHHYVMGKDEIQYLDITDISTDDLKALGKLIDQAPKDYLDKNKDAENKFYSGENFKNFLQAEGTFEKATANLASFLQKFSKQLLPLVTDNASAKGRVGDLVTNYGKSRDLAQNILNSVFSDTSLQGGHNYIDTSTFKKALANYFWKAIGLDESSYGNLDFSGAIQADDNRAVTEFLRFRTLKPSDKQRYMPDEAINAINEYAYDVAYNFLKNLKNEQGFNKYNVDDIMKKFTIDDFLKNNPMGLSTAMLKNIKGALNKEEQEVSQKASGSEKKDGYKRLEESLTPLKESIDKLSTNLESVKTPLENLSNSLAPVFDNINNSGILNNQAEPTQDDIENIKERIKKAIEEEKYQLKLEVSDDEIANFINSISSKISNTKGISLKINTDNLVQQVRNSFKGQKISTEITPQDSPEKAKIQIQEFDDAILNRPVDLKKNKQYINRFFTENKDKNVLRYGGEIFQSYLKSDKNYSNFSSELSKYLGPKILEALVKMGSTSPEVLSKLKQIESSTVMDKIISTAFDNKHIKGEKNYVNQEKYNESILKTLFKYLGINANKGRAIKADLLNTINADADSPLNKAVSGFVQFDDKYSLYPKELLDALTRYINQSIELDKQKSKQKEERNPKNVPWDKNPRNPASKNFDPNTIPVGKREEVNAKRVSNGLQPFVFTDTKEENKQNTSQQKANVSEDNNELKPIASNISELKDAISENTTAVNGLTKAIGDINNGVGKTNENSNAKTTNTSEHNAANKQEEVTEAVKETTAELEHQNNLREESVAKTNEQVKAQKEVSKEAEKSTKNGYVSSRDMFLDAEAERGKNKQSKKQADINRESNEFRSTESGKNYRESMSAKIISGYKELETLQVQLQDMYLNGAEESAISSQIAKINEKKSALQELISKIKELNEAEKSEQNNYNSDKYNPSSKNNYANDFINNKFNNYEDIANALLSNGFNGQTLELEERINRINQLINEVREKDGLDITNKEDVDYLNNIENKIKTIFSEINNKDNKNLFNVAGESSVLKELTSFSNYISKNTRARGLFGDRIDNLQEQANILAATPDKISLQRLKDFRAEFIKLKNDISAKGVGGISFFDRVSERLRETGAYFASFVSVYQVIGLIKQCASTVVDLNSKLIELSKVSNTSIADLEHQFQDFQAISKEVGGTISDTIQATADWSRNGYSLPDSKELARVAQIYKNVGDGININEANESLISTLRGYELEAKDALSIVDKINEVANTQPIDSGGLGEALQRSAASFRAANTSLSESIALITASNSVVQDPKRVGNMWKTVSARIRGASAELQEMGEDTDGMVESTSKLRDLVKGITGFDIMQDEQTYKSIYEIVLGIGEVWKDLSDIDQAALLEKLAGKTQSNALAAALNNVDILKEAYASAENSEGSATQEQQRFSEGIQYRINQFNEAREALSHTLIDSDLFKGFVDGGTKALEIIDQLAQHIGGLSVILTSLLFAKGFTNPKVGMLGYFVGIGTEVTKLISLFGKFAKIESLANIGMTLGKTGTAALGVGAVVALSAAFTTAYKAYDNYIHKYSDSMDAMRKHTSGIEDQKKEIDSLNEEYQSIQNKITEINNLGGAKVSREGELEQLQAQSKELERQIALKKASVKVELGKAYKESQKVTSAVVEAPDQVDINAINAEMTREEYLKTNFGIYGGSKTKTRVSVDKAIPRMIAQYDALIAKRKEYQDQVDKLSHDKSGAYNEGMALDNADSINEAREKIEEYNLSIEESREQLVQWYNDVQDRADVIETYAEYGHILDENDKATIALAKSTKEQLEAMDEAEAAANGAANGQSTLHNSVVKTKEQMASQKTAVDNLISSYRELFELSTKGDGLDVVLDEDQLTKYGNALEYVNGVYKLNTDKLFELAEANNQAKISELDHEKQLANMKYLKNAKEIEIYNDMLKEGKSLTEDGGSIKGRIANLKAENQAIVEQNNIRNYQISQLENVTSAYQKWLAVSGQEVDAKAFTGVQDASKSILELLEKGKVGLDSYKMAVDFIVPDGPDREDEASIQKYVKKLQPYFNGERSGVEKFMTDSSYFEGDVKNGFTLKEGTSVADIAKDMNWTIEVTRAMIDQLETYGGEFKWNIDGMFSDTDKLVHYQEELAKINEEKETFNMDDLSDADSERLDELNKQAEGLIKKIDELQGKVNKTTFDKINKGVEDSGGVDAVHKGYEQLVELGADQQTISDYVKKTTGVTTPQEVQLYTDEAQKNVEALTTQLDTLKEKYESGELALSYDDYQQKVQDLTDQIQEQGFMVQMLNEVLLEDAGVSTEETVSKIASILTEISGYVGTIAAREPEEKPSGDEGKGNTGGGGKPVFNSNDFNGELPEGLQDTHVVYTLEADTSNAEEGLETTTDAAKKAEGPWSIKLGEAGGSLIKSTLDSISAKIRTLKSQKHIINIGIQTTGSVPKMGGLNDEVSAKGNVFANGNAFARGNDIVGEQGRELVVDPHKGIWYTVGNSGTEMIDLPEDAIVYSHNQTEALLKSGVTTRGKSTGRSFADGTLVGERGRELIVDPNIGQWYTVGENGSEMIDFPKDAIVYNHQQTEDLLKNGHTSRGHSTGASFASGNAYVRVEGADGDGNGRSGGKDTTGGRVPGRPSTVTKSSANAAKSAEKAAKAASDAAEKAKDATDEAKNNMIWIDRAIEHQERKVSKINELVEDDFQTYTERLSSLDELREELALQNEILSDALERRVEEFDKAFQELVEVFGEDVATDLLHKIEVGSVDKDTYKDEFGEDEAGEKKKKALDKVIDAYDEETKLSDKLRDNEKEIRDAVQKEYEFRLNIIEAEKDQLQFEMDTLEHNLDMKDILGRMVTEGDYQDMIDQSEEIADNIERTIDVLEEQLTTVDEGSAKYNEINSQLISAKKELQDIEKQQAEWNDKIMRLPIERIDRYINMLNNIKKDLENWSAEQNVLGIDTTAKTIEQRFDIAQRAIKKYNEQVDKYRDLLSHYEYGSDKFEETANSIQDCEDNVSSLIQEMRELNIQFLKLPIDDITKANEKLQNINAAEQRVLDDYDTALSAVLSKFDQLIDKRNDEIDILNKRYDEMIKPYQDQLDLLNEQNEAKQMQYNIDKAQYDLDKARQQKNVQVVRNGRIEYDSDIDALKSAQDNLNNAKHDKAVYDLQQQIDALEKERDSKIEPLEKEIEKLEDARNRWQTFEDERTFEKEAAEAVRLLGANWEKAIEGTITNPHSDDREYDIFSKNHIQLDRQITNNEKQIENNERMIDLMTRYVDAYMSGEMTYEEARSQYDKLYKDYQSGATLTSQESLAAELAFNRAKDMGDALRLNNAETKKSYDSFLGQLEKANEYNKTIDKYTKTWDEINESITKQLAELERLAALAEEIAAQRRSSGGGRSSGGSDGGGGEWSKNPTGYGAGTKYNPYGKGTLYEGDAIFTGKSLSIDNGGSETSITADKVEVKSSGKSHYNHSSASGPASDTSHKSSKGEATGPALGLAIGLKGGMIGNMPPSEKFKRFQAMGLKPLEPDEVPAFLHVGEGVVNSIQQGNILKSVASAFNAGVMSSIPTDAVKSVENNYTFDCQFGDFILPNVEDTNGFASAMKNNFESIMNQQFSKIF